MEWCDMNRWKKKRVFVSGGAGVIGTALVRNLLERDAKILIGDLKPMPTAMQGLVYYRQGDLIDMSVSEVKEFSPEVFFHLAATFERSEESEDFWHENFHHNVSLSHHLMTILKDLPSLKQVIFASSYLVYDPTCYLFDRPQTKGMALDETSPILPRNLCGMAKLNHEHELSFIKKIKPYLQTISTRIFRSYGKNSRDIISRWIRAALKNETLTVYKPEGIFDYVYADDVATAILLLADTSFDGVVNVGTGKGRQVSEVLEILKKHFMHLSIRSEEIEIPYEASQAKMDKFFRLTGWKNFRTLEETIPELISFENS